MRKNLDFAAASFQTELELKVLERVGVDGWLLFIAIFYSFINKN